jgi:hypothetical protein
MDGNQLLLLNQPASASSELAAAGGGPLVARTHTPTRHAHWQAPPITILQQSLLDAEHRASGIPTLVSESVAALDASANTWPLLCSPNVDSDLSGVTVMTYDQTRNQLMAGLSLAGDVDLILNTTRLAGTALKTRRYRKSFDDMDRRWLRMERQAAAEFGGWAVGQWGHRRESQDHRG